MTDDSEEIFRRAAEYYPLKTDNPDWDAVRKKMEGAEAGTDETLVARKKNRRWLLLLLLLLPFAVIEYKYSPLGILSGTGKHAQTAQDIPVAATTKTTEPQAASQTTTENKERTTGVVTTNPAPLATNDLNKVNTTTVDPAVAKQKNSTTNTTSITTGKQTASLTHSPGEENAIAAKHTSIVKENKTGAVNSDTREKTNLAHHGKHITSKQKSKLTIKKAEATGDDAENNIASTNNQVGSKEKNSTVITEPEVSKIPVNADKPLAKVEPAVKPTIADSTKTTEKEIAKATTKNADKEVKKKNTRQKHFYVGLMAGPDLSAIKMQSLKKVGVSFGFIAGYRINKNFSIETGFFKDEKKYCSDGKYFSTKKIQTYPNSTIDYVSGTCYMYEIPLNVSYTFVQKKRSTMFATAGISSYLMNKESYDYDVKYYNTFYPYSKEYKSHDDQLAAVINISAGYTHKLGKIGDIRIEPYVKLPVNKVGTGDLPIQSFGVMVGFTKKLF